MLDASIAGMAMNTDIYVIFAREIGIVSFGWDRCRDLVLILHVVQDVDRCFQLWLLTYGQTNAARGDHLA